MCRSKNTKTDTPTMTTRDVATRRTRYAVTAFSILAGRPAWPRRLVLRRAGGEAARRGSAPRRTAACPGLLGEVPELWVELVLGERLEGLRRTGDAGLPGLDQVDRGLEQARLLLGQVIGLGLHRVGVAAPRRGRDELVGLRVGVPADVERSLGVE